MRLVSGIGINDVDYKVAITRNGKQIWMCPFYRRWRDMLNRAGLKWQTAHPSYAGTDVCKDWIYLSKFKMWLESHEFETFDGLDLDKDILVKGNSIYSPETCALVPQWLNKLLVGCERSEDSYLGVYYKKKNKLCINELSKPYYAQIHSIDSTNQIWLGAYTTPQEAHKVWQLEKQNRLKWLLKNFAQRAVTDLISKKP